MSLQARRLLLALVVLAFAGAVLWFPFDLLQTRKTELAEIGQRIGELEKRIFTREELLAEVRLLERTSPLASLLLHGETNALAGAELQGELSTIVEASGGTISQTQVLPGRNADPFVQIGARIDFSVSMEGLRDILHSVESNEPVMIIDRMTLASERSADAEIGERVEVSMEIAAFSQKQSE